MKAEIISIGNELLNGKTVNSNSTFISQRLYNIGISTYWVDTVGDLADAIQLALETAFGRSRIILLTGGLGPTHDDITKKVVADFFDMELEFNEDIFKEVKQKFERRGIRMPENNRSQAMLPKGAELMPNPVGTARGMIFRKNGKLVFVMPGVPREMKAMIDDSVIPLLQKEFPVSQIQIDHFRTTGIPESEIYERVEKELPSFQSYEIAFLPQFTGVDIRVIRKNEDIQNQQKFDDFKDLLNRHISEFIYTADERELEEVVGQLLKEKSGTIAVAESLTGGLVENRLTNVPGSSDYFMGGVVAYSNQSKMKLLNVKQKSLEAHGAVSEVVAKEMATGVRNVFGTTYGISTTGIAGPSGGSAEKPVGLMYVGFADGNRVLAKNFSFGGDRSINKQRSAQAALEILRRGLLGMKI